MIDHARSRFLAAKSLGSALTPAESDELESHLATCPTCRSDAVRLRQDNQRLVAALADVSVAPRVRAAVLASAQARRRADVFPLLAAAALLLLAVLVAALVAAPPTPIPVLDPTSVRGTYTYVPSGAERGRSATVDVAGTDPVAGTWSFHALPDGPIANGRVTCLVVAGDDAFMFGPNTAHGGRAAFFWVRDGGDGGTGDLAITWMQDLPEDPLPPGLEPQTLEEMEGWCLNAGAGFPGLDDPGLAPLTSGSVTVHEASEESVGG